MKHYRQPNGNTCGQTSFAMVTGITPEEAIKLYGHDKATRFSDHVAMLKKNGYDVTEFIKVDNRKQYELPETCMVRLCKSGKRTGHMVVHHKGKFYDPARENGVYDSREELLKHCPDKWRIEYYLEIKGKNNDTTSEEKSEQLELPMVAGERRFSVRVSHDIFKTGRKHYIAREVTETQLEKLYKDTTFKVELANEIKGE